MRLGASCRQRLASLHTVTRWLVSADFRSSGDSCTMRCGTRRSGLLHARHVPRSAALGLLGKGTPADESEAKRLFALAAHAGNAMAQFEAGTEAQAKGDALVALDW